jgi:endonuclease G
MRLAFIPIAGAGLALLGAGVQYLPGLPARAALSSARCATEFAGGMAPRVPAETITPLCFRHYAVGYSARTLTPSWSAERLTGADVEKGWSLHREDDFHAEPALLGRPRAELSDYRHSGYDRGHMTPSADMPDPASQDESFSLANVVPQNRDNNRHIWSDIEQTVRRLARADGAIYVVTGPIVSSDPQRLQGRVAIPVALYKAVYVPGQGAAAYISNNVAVRNWRAVPIKALVDAGIDPFPGVSERETGEVLALPAPFGYHRPSR